ncbi:MAG TPA: MBL fold metallo-hydrolase, partial [Bryobacteraceae bacterium]|nr:MBL fold metallo-hydrolase [Bryobacteraceae bacterium]
MIQPVQKDAALLADIAASNVRDGGFRLWWLGQSGFLLQWEGVHVLLDPYLSDSLTRKYAATDKPHVRMTERVVDPAELRFCNVVTSSHNHTDHLDGETLRAVLTDHTRFLVPEVNRPFAAERAGVAAAEPVGLSDGESVELCGVRFTGVMSAHEALAPEFLGYVLQFGRWSLYHSGDTILYDGMAEKLKPFGLDVALLPINGRGPERRVAGNLWGREAAWLAKE